VSATAETGKAPRRPRWQDEPLSAARVVEGLGRATLDFIAELGAILTFAVRLVPALFGPPYRVQLWFKEMQFVGVGSFFIICVTGAFMGMVLVLEGLWAFKTLRMEVMVGSTVEMFLAREFAPVFGGIIVTARAGSAITTELGSMRVTEQIDAMEAMAVDPMNYLVAPRVLAVTFMVPALCLIFNIVGFGAAYLVFVYGQGYDAGVFWSRVTHYLEVSDITHGLWKAVWFGLSTSIIACYMGYSAKGGAAGVGVATTRSVVYGCVAILFLDYIVTAVGVDL
jgi:phospholipid/cholesterol/gamma-HCH transport system permease protein